MAASNVSLERQAALVKEFASANILRLNAQKCEVVVFGTSRGDVTPRQGGISSISEALVCFKVASTHSLRPL